MIDVLIVGAGPAGLYAGFQAASMGLTGMIVETNSTYGGQPRFLYPDKPITNFPGMYNAKGMTISESLYKQYSHIENEFPIIFNTQVTKVEGEDNDFKVHLSNGEIVNTAKIVIAIGRGGFKLNTLDVPTDNSVQIIQNVSHVQKLKGKNIVVLGGGDSAVDAALGYLKVSDNVSLIHRREEFRAHSASVSNLKNSSANLYLNELIKEIKDKKIYLQSGKTVNADSIYVAYGMSSLPHSFDWKVDTVVGKIKVSSDNHETSVPGIYAIGTICSYKHRVNLISVAVGEAAKVINNIQKILDVDYVLGY